MYACFCCYALGAISHSAPQLPADLPASFGFETLGASGRVSYQLVVRCLVKGVFKFNMRNTADIVIHPREPEVGHRAPAYATVSQAIRLWGIAAGSVAITGRLDKVRLVLLALIQQC